MRNDMTETETEFEWRNRMRPGDYGKDKEGSWWISTPSGIHVGATARLTQGTKGHKVTEHADGTITAEPSILLNFGDGNRWHGFLKNGVWSEC